MRVLLFTGSAARYMLPPRLGDEQVVAGPDWPDETGPDGRVISLATPTGEFDATAIAAGLPAEQRPDVVACLVDSSHRCVPRQLLGLKCLRVLLVADTHHFSSPLIGMLRYAAGEPFHRTILLYDRHHADIFRAAGIREVQWFPGLTFPHADAAVWAARNQGERVGRVAFVGQTAGTHWRRTRLLGALAAAGVAVEARPMAQREALGFYGESLLGFNASLNGDLNLRVFEIMAAGAALLTDRLSAASGAPELFGEGREWATYGDSGELCARAKHLLESPAEARVMGAAAARWFDENLGEQVRRDAFRRMVFDGVAPARFECGSAAPLRVTFGGGTDRLLQALMVYEGVQELHRKQETVRVFLDPDDAPEDFGVLCATLPRVAVSRDPAGGEFDLVVTGVSGVARAPLAKTARFWCWDAAEDGSASVDAHAARAGFARASQDVAVFCRAQDASAKPPSNAPAEQAAEARALLQQGNQRAAYTLARAALAADARSFDALLVLGELALQRDGGPLAEKILRQAMAVRPGDPEAGVRLADALRTQGKFAPAAEVLSRILRRTRHHLSALLALARLRAAENQPRAAEAALREAVAYHPAEGAAARALGDLLKRRGALEEALQWHHRALGGTRTITGLAGGGRAVRVVFVAQHPQGWTSLQSVWEAFAADPGYTATIVAAPYLHPYGAEGGAEAIFEFLRAAGVPFESWEQYPIDEYSADVVFLQNPYDVTRPPSLRVPELLRRVPRLAYVPYGLEIGGGEANARNQFNLPLQQLAWAVFARSVRHQAMFARHCAVGDAHVRVTGHPRLDAIQALGTAAPDPAFAAFARGRKLVCWNPQFDVKPDGTGYSTFLTWQGFLLEQFAARPDLAFVIRPHPLLFGTLEQRQLWRAAEVADFLARVERAGNILIDRSSSYLPVFAAAAAMISDASTFLLEFTATRKPLLYLHNPRGPQLNDDGEFIRRHIATAERAEEITAFLDQVAAGEDPGADARMAAFNEVMHAPPGGVAAAIKRAVGERLAAEAGFPALAASA